MQNSTALFSFIIGAARRDRSALDEAAAKAEAAREWLRLGKPERALSPAREAYRLKRSMANAQLIRDVKNRIHETAPPTQLMPARPQSKAPPPAPKLRIVPLRPGIAQPIRPPNAGASLLVAWFLIGMVVMTMLAAALVAQTVITN